MRCPFRRWALFSLFIPLLIPNLRILPAVHGPNRLPSAGPGDVVINEVAWAGTDASSADEWIELHNTTAAEIDLTGWTLSDGADISIALSGPVPAAGYFLLERTADDTIVDIPADQTYSGSLGNSGESLELRDDGGALIDTANGDGGPWPAGSPSPDYPSMERVDPLSPDTDANWDSNTGPIRNGHDANGTAINGTPKLRNSVSSPMPDLYVRKEGPAQIPTGQTLRYTILLGNVGNDPAPQVRLTDTLPLTLTFASQSSPYTFTQVSSHTLLWEIGAIPFTLTLFPILVSATVPAAASGEVTNRISATTPTSEVAVANNYASATTELLPPGAEHVVINEFVVKGGEWIELYNPQATAVDIGGWRLTSDRGGLDLTIPAGTTLPGNAYYSVDSGGLFLHNDGDRLHLSNATSQEVDAVGYGIRGGAPIPRTGDSTARVPNGYDSDDDAGDWNLDGDPTQDAANDAAPVDLGSSLVINELDTEPASGGDRVEIYNPTTVPLAMTDWILSDGDGATTVITTTVVAAGGWLALEMGTDTTSNMAFSSVDVAYLFAPDGTRVDQIGWYGEPEDDTFQRICDGEGPHCGYDWASSGGGYTWYDLPATLGGSNCAPWPLDAAIVKQGPTDARPGQTITYTLLYSMTTVQPCPALRITDTLPATVTWITFTAIPAADWNGSTTEPVFSLGAVQGASPGGIEISVRVDDGAVPGTDLVNQAVIFCAADVTGTNDLAWVSTPVVSGEATAIYLPLVLKGYLRLIQIDAVLYDGYQNQDADEAVRLANLGTVPIDLTGWELCKYTTSGSLACALLPATVLSPMECIWLARDAVSFTVSFGFPPDHGMSSWLPYGLSNDGDEVVLRNAGGGIEDVLVYGNSPFTITQGWNGPSLDPYYSGPGQVLQRTPAEDTGWPLRDTDTAGDWMQYPYEAQFGRRALYPGWDMDLFFQPLAATEEASVTVAIAPDNAAEVFLSAIDRAQTSIEAEFYELGHYGIVQALVEKAQQGKDVVILLEGGPVGGLSDQERWACQQLEDAGGHCWFMFSDASEQVYDRYTRIHSKLLLVDRKWVVISSQNPTAGGMPDDDKSDGTWGSRGVLLLTDAPSVVARAAEIVDADLDPAHHNDLAPWGSRDYLPPPPNYVPITSSGGISSTVQFPQPLSVFGPIGFELFTAPEAALRHSDALLGLLSLAGPGDVVEVQQMYEHRAWGEMPDGSPGPNLRLEAYLDAARRGAQVRVLLNSGFFGQEYIDTSENLETLAYANGVAICEGLDLQVVVGDPTDYGVHNKMVLVELGNQAFAHIGSINGSETSNKLNREVAIQVRSREVFDYLHALFEWDWGEPSRVLVSEVLYNPEGDDARLEWVELYNPTPQAVNLSGWTLGDAVALEDYGDGRYRFPSGAAIPPRALIVVAAQAVDFRTLYGFSPDYEFVINHRDNDPAVPDMEPVQSWPGFGFALGNSGDEVLLLNAGGELADALVYGDGAVPGVLPYWGSVSAGHSLERFPPDLDTDDCSTDFSDNPLPTPAGWPAGYPQCGTQSRAAGEIRQAGMPSALQR